MISIAMLKTLVLVSHMIIGEMAGISVALKSFFGAACPDGGYHACQNDSPGV
jgi:hypothetical protein